MKTALKKYNYHPYIDEYMRMVEQEEIESCKEQKDLMKYIRSVLDRDDVVIHSEDIKKSINVPAKYFTIELYAWQRFLNALMYGVRYDDGRLVWNEILILMGRGGGKTGWMAYDSFYMSTSHNGIQNYDIEIVATSEEQAERTFLDVHEVLESEEHKEKLSRAFKWTKTKIQHKKTRSVIKYNTSNARTKDGKRAGCAIFDEVHEYEDYKNINIYTSSQGKVKDSRIIYTTTDGYIRGGPLDELKEKARMVLSGELKDLGFLPFICKLDSDDEVEDETKWEKSNPSYRYNKDLQIQMRREYKNAQFNSSLWLEFMTKRMNRPQEDVRKEVATYEDRLATEQQIPVDIKGIQAIGGVDFADVRDFCSVGLLFKKDGKRYWIHHTFIHHMALKLQDINPDIIAIAKQKGLCTIIHDDKSISPERVVNWFLDKLKQFNIKKISMDKYRAAILKPKLEEAGFEVEIVRRGPSTHAMLSPLVDEMFINQTIVFGDDPMMRWYVGNVYKDEKGNGNMEYCKIDKEKRKTDGFFAFLHALVLDGELKEPKPIRRFKVSVF
ncbi:terminase large subunit [Virgibacillus salarius]|uniref:terminase TerL endonuclease subunit n=1 Tax=Virgibacillus salarius TaxID=447199 RepID=UPI00248FC7E7|nr:terminase TerL endonuclease subunit [Virgibacillus salarius]WBX80130.1 terminase large subunit [Virgibacillus salarius]